MLPLKDHLLTILPCCSTPDWQPNYEKGWPDGPWYIKCTSCNLALARGFLYEFAALSAARLAHRLSLLGQTSLPFPDTNDQRKESK